MNPGILTPPTQFATMPRGLLGRPTPVPMPDQYWHPDALGWQAQVIANGGSVSPQTLRAASQFCHSIEIAGIRDRFYRLNLFCGTGLAAALVPLYRGQSLGGTQFGNSTDTNFNFVASDYAETGAAGGLRGNGTSKYIATGFIPSTLSVGSVHLSAYARTANSVTTYGCAMGAFVAAGGSEVGLYFNQNGLGSPAYFASDNGPGFVQSAANNPVGHLLGSTTATNDRRFFLNGSQSGSTVTANSSIALPSNRDVFVFRRRQDNAVFGANFTDARLCSYSIGLGMTAAQASAFYTAMQAFQTALSRNV